MKSTDQHIDHHIHDLTCPGLVRIETGDLVSQFVYNGAMRMIDLTGQRFGRLTVLQREGTDQKSQQKLWLCKCDCGNTVLRVGNTLKRGNLSNCGCLIKDIKRGNAYSLTHGKSKSGEYKSWSSMIQRCTNPKHASYKNYGARGVSVCEEWLGSFEQFFADMGSRPEGHSIERIDSDKNYEPGNCKWSSRIEQQNNKRNNRLITVSGKEMTVAQFSKISGINPRTLYNRIAKLEKA